MQRLPDRKENTDARVNNAPQRSAPVRLLFRCFIALILVSSIFVFATRLMKYNELRREKEELQDQIDDCEDDIDKLERDLAAPMDDEYIIRVAREKLNLYFPDETIFYGNSSKPIK